MKLKRISGVFYSYVDIIEYGIIRNWLYFKKKYDFYLFVNIKKNVERRTEAKLNFRFSAVIISVTVSVAVSDVMGIGSCSSRISARDFWYSYIQCNLMANDFKFVF